MEEAYVRLLCPGCGKQWEQTPRQLPTPDTPFDCVTCETNRRLSEFARTEHDLMTIKRLA